MKVQRIKEWEKRKVKELEEKGQGGTFDEVCSSEEGPVTRVSGMSGGRYNVPGTWKSRMKAGANKFLRIQTVDSNMLYQLPSGLDASGTTPQKRVNYQSHSSLLDHHHCAVQNGQIRLVEMRQ